MQDVEEIFDEAEIAFMMEDYETAQAKYEQALKMDPQVRGGTGNVAWAG